MQRPGMNNQTPAEWYFYNQTVVQSGKTEFQRLWGQRQLADDWRRNNKTVLALDDEEEEEEEEVDTLAQDIPEELRDSLALTAPTDSTALDSIPQPELSEKEQRELEKQQEYENDPHRPEYYLKDIPFTEEQMAASNAKLMDGLYNSGIIYKDLMENLPLAERTFLRLMTDFPDFEHLDETYYNMYQLYSRFGYSDEAATYREKLMTEYPENEHAKLIADPNFEFKGRFGKQIEDSIYQETYDAYVAEEYNKVISNADYIAQEYPEGANRARFMFLSAMSRLSLGDESQFLNEMKEIVTKYPQSTVSELAGLYVKGLQNGRLLASGRMNNGSIWERRSYLDGEALEGDTLFSEEKNTNWMFVVAYERDSINENQLLFEMAQYNFSNFTIRNFDIEMEKTEGISLLKVKTFLNYDEAYIYLHRLTNNPEMARKMEGLKMFIISEDNMKKLTRGLSYADYFEFYDEVFDRVGKLQFDDDLLDDPQMEIQDPDDLYEMEREAKDDIYDDNDNFIF